RQESILDDDHMVHAAAHLLVVARRRLAPGVEEDRVGPFGVRQQLPHVIEHGNLCEPAYFPGRVWIARRMTAKPSSRSRPASGSRGARTVSVPRPVSAIASLMYCTSFGCVSRCNSGVYQR